MPSGHCILPVRVVEEITKKTLSKDTVYSYVVQKPDGAIANLSDLDGEVFESAGKVRAQLTQRIMTSVAKIVSEAELKAIEVFGNSAEQSSPTVDDVLPAYDPVIEGNEDQLVKLPDGTVARLKAFTNNT
jgi:hypothetical protein